MVGVDNHHVDEACGLKKKRLFNLLNCLLLAEKEPATMTKLEEAFFEVCVESNWSQWPKYLHPDGGFKGSPQQGWIHKQQRTSRSLVWPRLVQVPFSCVILIRSSGDDHVENDGDDGGEVWYWISEILQMINNSGVKLWSYQCSLTRCPTCIRLNVGTGNTDTKHVFSQNNSQSTKSCYIWSSTLIRTASIG